jgi:uncharacterized protein YndB with AHSA1/START domain
VLRKTAVLALVLIAGFGLLMLAGRKATFVVETSGGVGRSVPLVWQTLTEVETWPKWWPGVRRAALPFGWRKGAALDLILAGNPDREPARVVAVVPGWELSWARPGALASQTRTTLRLESARGGSRVTVASFIVGPQAFLARFTGRDAFVRYHRSIILHLKNFLEKSAPGRATGPLSPNPTQRAEPANDIRKIENRQNSGS